MSHILFHPLRLQQGAPAYLRPSHYSSDVQGEEVEGAGAVEAACSLVELKNHNRLASSPLVSRASPAFQVYPASPAALVSHSSLGVGMTEADRVSRAEACLVALEVALSVARGAGYWVSPIYWASRACKGVRAVAPWVVPPAGSWHLTCRPAGKLSPADCRYLWRTRSSECSPTEHMEVSRLTQASQL